MISILKTLFDWPAGIVVGNLLASAMWATPALIHLHRKLDRHHKEHMDALKKGLGNDRVSEDTDQSRPQVG
jgi:hypothetical protein